MSIVAGISEFFLEEFLSFGGNSSYEFEIDSSILNAIILFCYTGKIELSDVNAGNLSTAANTLKIRSLMTACSDFLVADTMKEKPSPSKSGELSKSSPNQVNDLLKTSLTKYGSLDQTLSKLENLDEFAGLMRALDPSKSDYVTLIPELFANCDQNLVARAAVSLKFQFFLTIFGLTKSDLNQFVFHIFSVCCRLHRLNASLYKARNEEKTISEIKIDGIESRKRIFGCTKCSDRMP